VETNRRPTSAGKRYGTMHREQTGEDRTRERMVRTKASWGHTRKKRHRHMQDGGQGNREEALELERSHGRLRNGHQRSFQRSSANAESPNTNRSTPTTEEMGREIHSHGTGTPQGDGQSYSGDGKEGGTHGGTT